MTIIAAAGRRIDGPDASPPRFPLANRDAVRERIRALFLEHGATGIVASGACGADLLAQDVGRQLDLLHRRMVLPFTPDTFRDSSVTDRPGDWGPLFDQLLAELAARGGLVTLAEDPGSDTAYAAVNRVILAEADRIAGASVPLVLLIWDGISRCDGDLTADLGIKARERSWRIAEVSTV
jgi:hypothetical protein